MATNHRHLLLELLEDLGKNRDLLKRLRDVLEDLIVELDDRHDLSKDLLNLLCELLRLTRRDVHLFHLGGSVVVLDLVEPLLLVPANEPRRKLVQEIFQSTVVVPLVVIKGLLQLLDLILGEFVRH